MANLYYKPELNDQFDIDTELYSGVAYIRVFHSPQGDLTANYAAGLALGAVLPAAYGGVATSNADDPRLQTRRHKLQKKTGMFEIVTTWVKITPRTAGGTYCETDKSRRANYRQFHTGTRVVAVATDAGLASIPVIGETIAGAAPTALTHEVCNDCIVVRNWQHGRHLVLSDFAALLVALSHKNPD